MLRLRKFEKTNQKSPTNPKKKLADQLAFFHFFHTEAMCKFVSWENPTRLLQKSNQKWCEYYLRNVRFCCMGLPCAENIKAFRASRFDFFRAEGK